MELLVVLGIMAILAAVSVPIYRNYASNAQATEIVLLYDSLRSGLAAEFDQGETSNCADVLGAIGGSRDQALSDHYARVSIAFNAVGGVGTNGYSPAMLVCGRQDTQGRLGRAVAESTFEELSTLGRVLPGATVTDSMVVFSAPLGDPNVPLCRVPVGGTVDGCGQAVAVPTVPTAATPQLAAPVSAPVPNPLTQATPEPMAPMSESVATDFSQPPLPAGTQYTFVDPSVWGWKTDNPDGMVEYGRGAAYGDTTGGNVGIVELEGRGGDPSNLYRDIATQPGARYRFSFDLSGRSGVSSQSAGVEVYWEGQLIDTLYPAGNTFGFAPHEYDLEATQAGSRIELRAVTQDGSGPVVDNLEMEYQGTTP